MIRLRRLTRPCRADRTRGAVHAVRRLAARAMSATVLAMALTAVVACERSVAPADPLAALDLAEVHLSARPSLVIADDGSIERSFVNVAARRLPDGMLLLADQGPEPLRRFGRNGAPLAVLARQGDGPGELRGPFAVATLGDSIFTFGQPPFSSPQITVLAADTGYVEHFLPSVAGSGRMFGVGRLASGPYVVRRGMLFQVLPNTMREGQRIADSVTFGLYRHRPRSETGDSHVSDTVIWLPPVVTRWTIEFPWAQSPNHLSGAPDIFAPVSFVVPGDSVIWFVSSEDGRLRAYGSDGHSVRERTLPIMSRELDRVALRTALARALETARRAIDSAAARATYDEARLPSHAPLVTAAYATEAGGLWLQLFDELSDRPQRFAIVDASGALTARAALPAGFEVQQIGRDFVLGIERDSLGVQRVVEYAYEVRRPDEQR